MFVNDFFENYLKLVFQNIAHPNIGDAAGLQPSAAAGNVYTSLHTLYPGRGVTDQTTNEAAYTPYVRIPLVRSVAGWTVAGGNVSNAALLAFAKATAGSETILFAGLGFAVSGVGELYGAGHLGSSLGPFSGDLTTDEIRILNHGLVADQRVVFYDTPGGTIPTGITEGTVYFVIGSPGTDTFQISLTSGGAAVNMTADGAGRAGLVNKIDIAIGSEPQFPTGDLDIDFR